MSCFLTPDLKPFLGGTYFPPQDAYGRPGFKTVLKRIAGVWKQKKDDIKLQSADSMQQLVDMTVTKGETRLACWDQSIDDPLLPV